MFPASLCRVPLSRVYPLDPVRAESNDMLSLEDIQELLGLEILGLIPESKAVLTATNVGKPVIMVEGEPSKTIAAAFILFRTRCTHPSCCSLRDVEADDRAQNVFQTPHKYRS